MRDVTARWSFRIAPGLAFEGRSRQPPADVVNAALSYGYAIPAGEAVSALCAAGLDPAIGLLHADADRRPSLALDLMEEFRPLVVDQVVTAAVKRGRSPPGTDVARAAWRGAAHQRRPAGGG